MKTSPRPALNANAFSEAGRPLDSRIKRESLSDVIAIGDSFLCASDSSDDLTLLTPGKRPREIHLPDLPGHGNSDIEALAFDQESRRLYVSSEASGKLLVYDLDLEKRKARKIGEAEVPAAYRTAANKGIEGLAYLSSAQAPDGVARLIAVKEGFPRRILVFNPRTLELMQELKLPKEAKNVLADLSECEIDPRTGGLVIVSQEAARIFAFRLTATDDGTLAVSADRELELRGASQKTELRRRLESVTFTPAGQLVLGFEANGKVQQFGEDGFDAP